MKFYSLLSLALVFSIQLVNSQTTTEKQIIFSNVRVFDGKSAQLSQLVNVFIKSNKIEKIDSKPIDVKGDVVKKSTGKAKL